MLTGKLFAARHFDTIMRQQMQAAGWSFKCTESEEGFIDQYGAWMTRREAWQVAMDARQIVQRVGGDSADGGTLYSENLY